MDSFDLAGAHILPGVNAHGVAKGHVGHHGEAVHPHDDHIAGNDHLPQGVGQALHHQHRDGEDGLGDAGGHSQPDDSHGVGFIQRQIRPFQLKHGLHVDQLEEAEHRREHLCQNGGQGHAGNAHMKSCHKPNVQANVQHCGQEQKGQGGQGISHAPQNSGENVVECKAGGAQEEDGQIALAPVDDGFRRAQQLQQRPGYQGSHNHGDNGGNQGQGQAVANGLCQILPILGPIILGNHNSGAGSHTYKQGQHQIENRPCTAHSRQRQVPNIFAHHNGIHGTVELLGQVADEHGHGKFGNAFPGRPDGHILGGKKLVQIHGISSKKDRIGYSKASKEAVTRDYFTRV